MNDLIDMSRDEMLAEVRAKRASALRSAGTGNPREQEFWLGVAGRMTVWIEHLEEIHPVTRSVPIKQAGIRLPARRIARTPGALSLKVFESEDFARHTAEPVAEIIAISAG